MNEERLRQQAAEIETEIQKAQRVLADNPEAAFLDKVAGLVMDAADEIERRIGPMDEREYAAIVAILADRAVMQIAESALRRREG